MASHLASSSSRPGRILPCPLTPDKPGKRGITLITPAHTGPMVYILAGGQVRLPGMQGGNRDLEVTRRSGQRGPALGTACPGSVISTWCLASGWHVPWVPAPSSVKNPNPEEGSRERTVAPKPDHLHTNKVGTEVWGPKTCVPVIPLPPSFSRGLPVPLPHGNSQTQHGPSSCTSLPMAHPTAAAREGKYGLYRDKVRRSLHSEACAAESELAWRSGHGCPAEGEPRETPPGTLHCSTGRALPTHPENALH